MENDLVPDAEHTSRIEVLGPDGVTVHEWSGAAVLMPDGPVIELDDTAAAAMASGETVHLEGQVRPKQPDARRVWSGWRPGDN